METLRVVGPGATVSDPSPGTERACCLERCQQFRDRYDRICRAVEQAADTVLITDRQGVVEYVNPALEADPQTLLHPRHNRARGSSSVSIPMYHASGTRQVYVVLGPVFDLEATGGGQ